MCISSPATKQCGDQKAKNDPHHSLGNLGVVVARRRGGFNDFRRLDLLSYRYVMACLSQCMTLHALSGSDWSTPHNVT